MEKDEPHPRGRTDFWIRFAGLDAIPNSKGATFRFDYGDDSGMIQGTISFEVAPQGDGMNGMMARAHKKLGDILHKFLRTADTFAENYKRKSGP